MKLRHVISMVMIGTLLFGCANEGTNTCVEDQKDGNWQAIVDNSNCSEEQKGEAYLALGGFNYFDFITKKEYPLATIFGLTSNNWETKQRNYFDVAANIVRPLYASGSDKAKTVFLSGSFAGFFTYISGMLDNGGGNKLAFDGKIDVEELDSFVGASLKTNQGDGTTLSPTNDYQIMYGGTYYIVNGDTKNVYVDTSTDGIRDASADNANVVIVNMASWTVVNQVVHVDQLTEPLSKIGNYTQVATFATNSNLYLTDLENAIRSLITDDSVKTLLDQIRNFKKIIDNGANCKKLNQNPNLKLIGFFLSKSIRDPQPDYTHYNIFSKAELKKFYEDTTFSDLPGVSVETGVKLIYKGKTENYVPNWGAATNDVYAVMDRMSNYGTKDIKASDGEVTLAEVECVSSGFQDFRE